MRPALAPATFLLLCCLSLQAQTPDTLLTAADTAWKSGGQAGVNFTQSQFSNWAAGGQNSLSAALLANLFAKYELGPRSWETVLDAGYGFLRQNGDPFRKSDDRLELTTKFGYKWSKNWSYSFLTNFRSQFTKGYEQPSDTFPVSDFLAPGYLVIALGADYRPNENLSLFLSPLTSKVTFVTDQRLADLGKYGMKPAVYDSAGNLISRGETVRYEFGAYLTLKFRKEIVKNVTFSTKLDLFSNYLVKFGNIDVNWDCLLAMKVNKYLSASITTSLIYDDDVKIPLYEQVGATQVKTGEGPRVQFREVLAIGLAYTF
ncbi:MAG: DUF3078 domain-containing protein [Bacteroidota bacterium]